MDNFFLPFKGVYCKVQPIAFDGTLSFLELLGKIEDYLNMLNESIEDISTDQSELITNITTALNELRTYVDNELAEKQDTLTFDTTPTANSTNPVESKGIKTYVDNGLAEKQNTLTFDSAPTPQSSNPVTSTGIKRYVDNGLAEKQNILTAGHNITITGNTIAATDEIFIATYGTTTNADIYAAYTAGKSVLVKETYGGNPYIGTLYCCTANAAYFSYADAENEEIANLICAYDIWSRSNTGYSALPIATSVTPNGQNPVRSSGIYSYVQSQLVTLPYEIVVTIGANNSLSCDDSYDDILEMVETENKFIWCGLWQNDERQDILYYAGTDLDRNLHFAMCTYPGQNGYRSIYVADNDTWHFD